VGIDDTRIRFASEYLRAVSLRNKIFADVERGRRNGTHASPGAKGRGSPYTFISSGGIESVPLGLAAAYRKFHRGRANGSRGGGSIGGDEELGNCVLKRILQRRTVARFRNGRFVGVDSRDPPRRV